MDTNKADRGVILTGHSHVIAFGVPPLPKDKSVERSVELLSTERIDFYATVERWDGTRSSDYWSHTAAESKGKAVAIFWQGNQYNSDFLFHRGQQFDIALNGASNKDIIKEFQLVPVSVVKAHLEPAFDGLVDAINILKDGGVSNIIIIETPPPKSDPSFMVPHLINSKAFNEIAAKHGVEITEKSITVASVRQKLWRITQDISLSLAKRHNISHLPLPKDVLESDGTLKKEYWANDVTHANSTYGTRIKKHIADSILNGDI